MKEDLNTCQVVWCGFLFKQEKWLATQRVWNIVECDKPLDRYVRLSCHSYEGLTAHWKKGLTCSTFSASLLSLLGLCLMGLANNLEQLSTKPLFMLCRVRVRDTYSCPTTKFVGLEVLYRMLSLLGISALNASLVRPNIMCGMTDMSPYTSQ